MELEVERYCEADEKEWDNFVCTGSMNGTFLQTRQFINYHPHDRFVDHSLCVRKGNELVAVILACELFEDAKKIFFAHKGSTFGGITISKKIYSASAMEVLMSALDDYFRKEEFETVFIKMVSDIYQKQSAELLDYYLYKYGYTCYCELNYYMHLNRYSEDVISQFSSSKRRDYRYSLKNELHFKTLDTREEIALYYNVLIMNLAKLNLPVVHSLEDLYDLKFNRFNEDIKFFGVYHHAELIAGSMVFIFDGQVFHTQYLSSNEKFLDLFPMDFLIENLIQVAVNEGYSTFSFGICTEDRGKYLNLGLSRFKEGFGTEFCINRSYEKYL